MKSLIALIALCFVLVALTNADRSVRCVGYTHMHHSGIELRHYNLRDGIWLDVSSSMDCCKLCQNHPLCKYWTFIRIPRGVIGICAMKSIKGGQMTNSYATSGSFFGGPTPGLVGGAPAFKPE